MRLHVDLKRLVRGSLAAIVVLVLAAVPGDAATGEAGPGAYAAGGACTLDDQGWVPAVQEGTPGVRLRVLVTNHADTLCHYRVGFTVEESALADLPAAPASAVPGAPPATGPAWRAVKTVMTEGDVPAGSSVTAAAWISNELLPPGKAYRFSARLLKCGDPAALPIFIHRAGDSMAAALLAGGAAAAATVISTPDDGGADNRPERISPTNGFPWGRGTMVGTHEAHRVGSEWVEHGSGVIKVTGPGGTMIIDYTYDSHGVSADQLTATATGTGTLSRPNKKTVPVVITSATAQMKFAGARQQVGTVVTRTGGSATGTYEGTIDGKAYHGVLTMTNGTQTLDLATGQGQHSFSISFTASH